MEYSKVGDIIVLLVCLILILTLSMTYSLRNKKLILIKIGLVNLMYCCCLSIAFNSLVTHITEANTYAIYTCHNALQISLLLELVLFIYYVFDLVNYKEQSFKVAVLILTLLFMFLELTSIFTHIGFYIENNKVHNTGVSNLYFVRYALFMTMFSVVLKRKSKLLAQRIYIALSGTFIMCDIIVFMQWIHDSETYTTLVLLLPLIVLLFLFHSNSYNSRLGILDREALASRLNDLCRHARGIYFVYLQIPNFQKICLDDNFVEDLKILTSMTHYSDYLFRCSNDVLAFIYDKEICEDIFEKAFSAMKTELRVNHKLIIVPKNNVCKKLSYYTDFCSFLARKMTGTFYRVSSADFEKFSKGVYIKEQLLDIRDKNDLEDERVKVYCQPILDIESGKFTTAESLMRLELPDIGFVYPDVFIPIAESTGLIHTLTLIILNKVCKYIQANNEITRISVNFSMYEITKPDFYDDIMSILLKYNFKYSKLGFEVTESVEAEDFGVIEGILSKFRSLGIKIYLDDFGTGYSNMEHIFKLPIDIVKIDKSLVISSGENEVSEFVVDRLSTMFDTIGYSVLYEGIESKSDQDRCITMKARYLQGYRYSKPVPIENLSTFTNQMYSNIEK